MLDKDLLFLFGMSKMTVPHENGDIERYETLALVEFLEFLGRAADYKYMGSEMESFDLARKIEYLLDELFVPFELQRRPVEQDADNASESESDY